MMALEGIRVLDLSRLLPGPFATMFLADFGAEVIKIEQPGEGDYARPYWPTLNGMGYRFLMVNRNKKSMTLNLKAAKGKELFQKLVRTADVVIESFRPGVMKRLGLGYEDLKAINPRIIFCSLSGFGQTGPYAMEPGHDLNYTSLAGIPSLTGHKGEAPRIPGVQVADMNGGLMALIGILLALQARNVTGEGQWVDASLYAACLSVLQADSSVYFGSGQVPLRGETRLTGGYPHYGMYETADGRYMAVGALEKKFWRNLCTLIGHEDMIDAIDDQSRWPDVKDMLAKTFITKTMAEWEDLLMGKDTCVTPVRNLDEVCRDPHVLANELVVEIENEKFGQHRMLGIPVKLSATPGTVRTAAPDLGENDAELLAELGYDEKDLAAFKQEGVM